MERIKLIEIDSELGAGTRGASLGIGAMKTAAYNGGQMVFSELEADKVETMNEDIWKDITTPHARRIGSILEIFNRTCDKIKSSFKKDSFPLVISGDHSTAGGTISGIKAAYPDSRLGVIWIDAHADLHTPFTTPSGNVHGMPLATVLQIDNLECQQNEPDHQTIKAWNELKNCGTNNEKLKPEDLILIGVRDTEKQEDALIDRLDIKNFTVEDVRNLGVDVVASDTLSILSACDIIYVSFDVDSMDCDLISHGTGTPVKNGLTQQEANDLIQKFAANDKTVCIEFVEVNPCLDEKLNKMAETAVEILDNTYKTLKTRIG